MRTIPLGSALTSVSMFIVEEHRHNSIHPGSGHVHARRPIMHTQVSMESFAMHLRQKPCNIPRLYAGLGPKSAVNVTPKQVCLRTQLSAV